MQPRPASPTMTTKTKTLTAMSRVEVTHYHQSDFRQFPEIWK
jgi:hypothetical protein